MTQQPAFCEREKQVLVYIGKGFTQPEIARLLGLSRFTINDYTKRIFRALQVDNRVEAAVWACKQGWL